MSSDFESLIPRIYPDIKMEQYADKVRLSPCPACGSEKKKPCVLIEGSTKIFCHDGGCRLHDHPLDLREFFTEMNLWHKIGKASSIPAKKEPTSVPVVAKPTPDFAMNAEIYQAAVVFFHLNLLRNPKCKKALEYQLVIRGHRLETLKHFRVGFSGHLYDLPEKLLSLSRWSESEILGCGLFTPEGKLKPYMRFSYPIVHEGKTRSIKFKPLDKDDMDLFIPVEYTGTDFPLVLNSDELGANEPLLCEGENDLLSLWEHGATHTVATLGSLKARTLTFFDKEKVYRLAFDHDEAGRNYEAAMMDGFKTKVIEYPSAYKDPDDWLKRRSRKEA